MTAFDGSELDDLAAGRGSDMERDPVPPLYAGVCTCVPNDASCILRMDKLALSFTRPGLPAPPPGCEIVVRYCLMHEILSMTVRQITPLP